MRTALSTLAIAVLVLLAGCAAPFAADDPVVGQVTTTDSAVSGPAISVSATAEGAEAARSAVAADSERMRTALRDAGAPDDAVRTVNYAIYPQYDYRSEEREIVGYRAVHAYAVEVAPERAGEVVDVAVGNGATAVEGVTFTLSDETRAELRAQALGAAMTSARANADAIAGAADLTVTGVHEASTVADYGYTPVFRAAESDAAGAQTTFEPGPVTVTATVQVTYAAN